MKAGTRWIMPAVALAIVACKRGEETPRAQVVEEPEAVVVAEPPEPPPVAGPVVEPVADPAMDEDQPLGVVLVDEDGDAPHAVPVEEPSETAGQKLDRAIDATRGGLGTAARKTGEGIETAAEKTGEALETAGEKTEEGLRKAGAATGRWLNRMGEKIEHAAAGDESDESGGAGE